MVLNDTNPKYFQLAKRIKEQIRNGKLANGRRIPSDTELVRYYNVSRATVTRAIRELVNDGIIVRVQGKGSFVNSELGASNNLNTIVLLAPLYGHIHEKIYPKIIIELQKREFYALVINTYPHESDYSAIARQIGSFSSSRPHSVIIDGFAEFNFRELKKCESSIRNMTFCLRCETSLFPYADKVLPDFVHGGYIACADFIKRSRKKLLIITPVETARMLYPQTSDILKGVKIACEEHNMDFERDCKIIEFDYNIIDSYVKDSCELFKEGFDAVFATADFMLQPVSKAAKKLGIKVGEDIDMTGFYNTPWAGILPGKVKSVCINEEKIAAKAVDITLKRFENPNAKPRTVKIKPSLVNY